MIYTTTYTNLLHPDDSEQISIHSLSGDVADLSIRFGKDLTVMMTRKHAWDFLAQLADFLEDDHPCEICSVRHNAEEVQA